MLTHSLTLICTEIADPTGTNIPESKKSKKSSCLNPALYVVVPHVTMSLFNSIALVFILSSCWLYVCIVAGILWFAKIFYAFLNLRYVACHLVFTITLLHRFREGKSI